MSANIKADVKRAGQKAVFSPVIEALTRVGYGARGLIYFTMGLLALNVSLGKGSGTTDQQGAISAIGRQPLGLILLWAILLGLVSYALWGVIRAVFDPLHKGNDLKGLVTRAVFLFSAASYAILVLPTYGFIRGAGQTVQSGTQTQLSLASIMSKPWGPWAIGIVGLAVIAAGLYQVYQGINASFDRQFKTYAMTAQEVKLATQLGRFGTATRGLIIAVIGVLLVLAAYHSNSSQAIGFDPALTALRNQPYGIWLLGIVAFGLMAFGIYSMLSAAWFRLKR
jgi:Domain of Unknown Function (DUF1206)